MICKDFSLRHHFHSWRPPFLARAFTRQEMPGPLLSLETEATDNGYYNLGNGDQRGCDKSHPIGGQAGIFACVPAESLPPRTLTFGMAGNFSRHQRS